MNLQKIGTLLKKNTTREKALKLSIALILSNFFVFMLFSGDSEVKQVSPEIKGFVEVTISAPLLTPFQMGKKVLLIQRHRRRSIEGVLKTTPDESGKLVVLIPENEAHALFQMGDWEIIPFLKHLAFSEMKKGESHEIHY